MESTNENEATEILNRLVEQYQTPLRRMCFIMLRDEELAKDAVQDTFTQGIQKYRRIQRRMQRKDMADANCGQYLPRCEALGVVSPFRQADYVGGFAGAVGAAR